MGNLVAAYNGESNAHVRYAAFALKADEEGFTQVASLFRAASRAEEIHAANHATVIRRMGGNPVADIQPTDVLTTAENLVAAIAGETYERDVMYPAFIELAKHDGNKPGIRTFEYAIAAEIEHAILYTKALQSLSSMKGGKTMYFVCPVCGKTVTATDFDKCPVCGALPEKFLPIS